MTLLAVITPDLWLRQLFSAQVAHDDRKCAISCGSSGATFFADELHRCGFRAVENAGQVMTFCNNEPVCLIG